MGFDTDLMVYFAQKKTNKTGNYQCQRGRNS